MGNVALSVESAYCIYVPRMTLQSNGFAEHYHFLALALLNISIALHYYCSALALLNISNRGLALASEALALLSISIYHQ